MQGDLGGCVHGCKAGCRVRRDGLPWGTPRSCQGPPCCTPTTMHRHSPATSSQRGPSGAPTPLARGGRRGKVEPGSRSPKTGRLASRPSRPPGFPGFPRGTPEASGVSAPSAAVSLQNPHPESRREGKQWRFPEPRGAGGDSGGKGSRSSSDGGGGGGVCACAIGTQQRGVSGKHFRHRSAPARRP